MARVAGLRLFRAWLLAFTIAGAVLLRPTLSRESPREGPGDRDVDIQHLRLDLTIDLRAKVLDGRATLNFRTLRPLQSFALDAVDFTVTRAELARGGGKPAAAHFSHDGRRLTVDFGSEQPAGFEAVLVVTYRVSRPRQGLYFLPNSDAPDAPRMAWTQGEPDLSRYWFPCLDRPDQRQTTEVVVTVPGGFEAVSNGRLLERRADPGGKAVTFHWLQDKAHPSYLVALAVGRFEVVREEGPNQVPLLYYVPAGERHRFPKVFGRTREMVDFFGRRFGIPYPWDKYAQVVLPGFPFAMENTSATFFRASADEGTLLNDSEEHVLAHELGHQWWGDLVTCNSWGQLWLNEGFATYADALWTEHRQGKDAYDYQIYQIGGEARAGGRKAPLVDRRQRPEADVYSKGAWVLHMLRRQLGEGDFWRGLKRYGTDNRLRSVETADFRTALEAETGRDLGGFFSQWTERPGHPVVEVSVRDEPAGQAVKISLRQTQPGDAFQFPLTLAAYFPPPAPPIVRTEQVTGKEQGFVVPVPARPTRVEVDPEQAVLMEVTKDKARDLWLAQLRDSQSIVSRIRAAQHLARDTSPESRQALARAVAGDRFWGVRLETAAVLTPSHGEEARNALVAGLRDPSAAVGAACARQLGKFPGDEKAVAGLRAVLSGDSSDPEVARACMAAYAKLRPPDVVAVLASYLDKPRSLRSAALTDLGETRDRAALEVLVAWTRPGRETASRKNALSAIGRLAQTTSLNDMDRARALEAVTACLRDESEPVRRAALGGTWGVARSGYPAALRALDRIAEQDPDEGIRQQARQAAAEVRGRKPAAKPAPAPR